MTAKNKDLIVSEIHPGLPKQMVTAFEVPVAAAEVGMTLIIPEKGFFGSKKAKIRLSL